MYLTRKFSIPIQLLILALIVPVTAISANEPRIVGGFTAAPEITKFMAGIVRTGSGKQRADNNKISLKLDHSEYDAQTVAGITPRAFSGNLVDCGLAQAQCEGVSGNICLIQAGGNHYIEKIQNCESGGGQAAIIYDDQSNQSTALDTHETKSVRIPAVSINAQDGIRFINALGGSVTSEPHASSTPKTFCGATLIEKDWVVTAAHCVKDQRANALSIVVGGQDLANSVNEIIPVKRIEAHQGYSGKQKDDIALLQLEYPSETGKPIDIIDPRSLNSAIKSGATSYVYGRGTVKQLKPGESDNVGVSKLLVTAVPLIAIDVCQDLLRPLASDAVVARIGNDQLCTGALPEGGKGHCFGDSGGPLMVPKGNGSVYFAGVVTWAIGCGYPDLPDMYTRVPAYANAIEDVISGKSAKLTGDAVNTAVLGDADETNEAPAKGGGGALGFGGWIVMAMLRRRHLRNVRA